jgi:putative (di)nucleoside polyphosphate hydrolase
MSLEYRSCVVGVFVNEKNQVLAGERADAPGAWQLPQGGVDPGESVLQAIYREMKEELGCDAFEVVDQGSREIKYRFPEGLKAKVAKRYCGQSTTWFKLKFKKGAAPDLAKADGELKSTKWVDAAELSSGIIEWKRTAYLEGFRALKIK